tara:strand:- start:1301 stop:2203 length:903 start_codon:yes stop_codon:yes gene_type:complete
MISKVLVTGGNGYVGSQLIKYFKKNNINVHSLGKGKDRLNIADNYIDADITNPKELEQINSDYDYLIHCAGISNVRKSVIDPISDFEVNLKGTVNLLDLAKEQKYKFIFLSTVSVYNTKNILPLKEDSDKKVSSPYGASKLASESYCQAFYKTYDLDTRIIRLFNIYGPGMRHLFVADMIRKINKAKDTVIINGSGNQIRDYVYIDDVISAINIVMQNGKPGEDYNICSGKKIRIYDITKLLLKHLDKEGITIKCDEKSYAGDIEKWYGDPSKINKLGFHAKTNFDEGLLSVIKFSKEDK